MKDPLDTASLVLVTVASVIQGYGVHLVADTNWRKATLYYRLMLICYCGFLLQNILLVTSISFAYTYAEKLDDMYHNPDVDPSAIRIYFLQVAIAACSQSVGATLIAVLSFRRVTGLVAWFRTKIGRIVELTLYIFFGIALTFAILVTWLQYFAIPMVSSQRSLCVSVTHEQCIQLFSRSRLYNDPYGYLIVLAGVCDMSSNIYIARYMYKVILSINPDNKRPHIVKRLRPTFVSAIASLSMTITASIIYVITSLVSDHTTKLFTSNASIVVISVHTTVVFKVLSKILDVHVSSQTVTSLDMAISQERPNMIGRGVISAASRN